MVKRYALLALFCACLINAFSYHDDSGALNGVFSVNANGKKVQFAMGNLQFQSATHTWHFAEHQWDMLGEQNEIYGSTYNGWMDLFTFKSADWSKLKIPNGGNTANLWQTLTSDEWNFLISKRMNAQQLRSSATVCGVYGYIFLPDDWKLPKGIDWTPNSKEWSTNVYDQSAWEKMERAGAIFLPAAGMLKGTLVYNASKNGYYNRGFYWSSTSENLGGNNIRNHYATMDRSAVGVGWTQPDNGCAVRLVRIASTQTTQAPPSIPNTPTTSPTTIKGEGVINGIFSVAPGKQVYFSNGNLQYQASTKTWRFAEHQWDAVGSYDCGNVFIGETECNNALISKTYKGWIDLFGWGTGNDPTLYSYMGDYTTFADWGANAVYNGGFLPDLWRTLSVDEWDYLFDQRPNADRLHGQAKIEDQFGYILLPDNWSLPNGLTFKPEPNDKTTNVYTVAQWAKMEANGAVFLPSADYRSIKLVGPPTSGGYYWTSTPSTEDPDHAYGAWFNYRGHGTDADNERFYGYAVRLVLNTNNLAKLQNAPSDKPEIVEIADTQIVLPELEPEQEWKLYDDMHTIGDINPREGFRRVKLPKGSFGEFLRNYQLKDDWTLYDYTGKELSRQSQFSAYAVLDIDIGKKDLIQCADAIMLLRAEYLYRQKRYSDIHFNSVSGKRMNYVDYVKGDYSYAKFRKYIDYVAAYASTLSLEKELKPRKIEDIQVGDVLIVGGAPGHAMIVVDMAMDQEGNRALLFAEGMMPAQSIHVVTNLEHGEDTPWYMIDKYLDYGTIFVFPNYAFNVLTELKCFE